MYIGAEDAQEIRQRRYSVIGNDPSFKQYTKNHDYDELKYQHQKKETKVIEENILSVTLKDLAQPTNTNINDSSVNSFGLPTE